MSKTSEKQIKTEDLHSYPFDAEIFRKTFNGYIRRFNTIFTVSVILICTPFIAYAIARYLEMTKVDITSFLNLWHTSTDLLLDLGFPYISYSLILYCHRKFGPLSKTRLWYNIHLLERSIRWRNANEETSLPSLKPKLFLRHSAVEVRKQKCVDDITSAMNNFQSGSDSFLKMPQTLFEPADKTA